MAAHDTVPHRRVVLDDVARMAHVSRSTASRALVDDPRISEPTRTAVKHAASELRYVPNAAARSLRAQRTRILGLLLANLSDPVHGQIAAAFEKEALAGGYRVIFGAGLQDPTLERKALRIFTEHAADGVTMVSCVLALSEAQTRFRPDRLIMVQPDHRRVQRYRGPLVPGVIMTDDASGVEAVVDHLVATGYRDIAYIGSGARASSTVHREAVGLKFKEALGVERRNAALELRKAHRRVELGRPGGLETPARRQARWEPAGTSPTRPFTSPPTTPPTSTRSN